MGQLGKMACMDSQGTSHLFIAFLPERCYWALIAMGEEHLGPRQAGRVAEHRPSGTSMWQYNSDNGLSKHKTEAECC